MKRSLCGAALLVALVQAAPDSPAPQTLDPTRKIFSQNQPNQRWTFSPQPAVPGISAWWPPAFQ